MNNTNNNSSGHANPSFGSLLDKAHQKGFEIVSRKTLYSPSNGNGRAEVEVLIRLDGKLYAASGEVNIEELSDDFKSCAVTIAETKALARAIRFSLNIAVPSLVELPPSHWRNRTATEKQIKTVNMLLALKEVPSVLRDEIKQALPSSTCGQADIFIKQLNGISIK